MGPTCVRCWFEVHIIICDRWGRLLEAVILGGSADSHSIFRFGSKEIGYQETRGHRFDSCLVAQW